MDLGIAGRRAIVCASSRGLGRGCAEALAAEGVELVVTGRDTAALEKTATEIRQRYKAEVAVVPGDVSDPAIQRKLLDACSEADILVNNNAGPPLREFPELDREKIVAGMVQNMV